MRINMLGYGVDPIADWLQLLNKSGGGLVALPSPYKFTYGYYLIKTLERNNEFKQVDGRFDLTYSPSNGMPTLDNSHLPSNFICPLNKGSLFFFAGLGLSLMGVN